MNAHGRYGQFVGGLAIALFMLVLPAGASAATRASGTTDAHVYLLRGLLNIFSLGLDEIAAKLQQQGIPVTIANYVSWSSIADQAAADYKSGRVKTIILVGHSSGATVLPDMVARLDQLGAPPKLAIGLDSIFRTKLAGRAGRYINFYIGSGAGEPVTRTKDFHGTLENINVQDVPGVGHITIEKNEIIQRRVINAIDAVAFNNRAKATAGTPAPPPEAAAAKPTATADGSRP
jgi:hypothetical protein